MSGISSTYPSNTTGDATVASHLQRLGLDAQYEEPLSKINESIASYSDDPMAQIDTRDQAKDHIRNIFSMRHKLADALIQALPVEAFHDPLNNNVHIYFNKNFAHVVGAANAQQAGMFVRQAAQSASLPPHQAQLLRDLIAERSPTGSRIQPRTIQQVKASHNKAVSAAKVFNELIDAIAVKLPPAEPEVQKEPVPQPPVEQVETPPAQAKAGETARKPSEKPSDVKEEAAQKEADKDAGKAHGKKKHQK